MHKYTIKMITVMFCAISAIMFSGCKEKVKPDSKLYKYMVCAIESEFNQINSLLETREKIIIEIAQMKETEAILPSKDKEIKKFEKLIVKVRTNKLSAIRLLKIKNSFELKLEQLNREIHKLKAILTSDSEPGS